MRTRTKWLTRWHTVDMNNYYHPPKKKGEEVRVFLNQAHALGILAHLLRMVMEPKYYAFRRWLDTPIIIWQGDWIPRDVFCLVFFFVPNLWLGAVFFWELTYPFPKHYWVGDFPNFRFGGIWYVSPVCVGHIHQKLNGTLPTDPSVSC